MNISMNDRDIKLFSDETLIKLRDAMSEVISECHKHYGEISNETYVEATSLYTITDFELIKRNGRGKI